MKDIFWMSDLHIPYENKKAVKEAIDKLSEGYDTLVLGGDILDFMAPSRFEKEPDQEGTLQKELNTFYRFMDKIREVHGGDIIFIIGNHETRIQKYLKRNHELYGLDVLKLENLLKADEYEMKVLYEWHYKGMMFTHGRYANKYSANKELEVNGISGISGHVHRHAVQCKTDRSGTHIWISAPCLQDFTKQDFAPNPNWQTGYVTLYFEKNKFKEYKVVLI